MQAPNQNQQPVNGLVPVNVNYIKSKINDKKEVSNSRKFPNHLIFLQIYRFLSSEVKCYLDEYDNMTIYHLTDLFKNIRLRIYAKDAKPYNPPQFEGITIPNMLEWAKNYPRVL